VETADQPEYSGCTENDCLAGSFDADMPDMGVSLTYDRHDLLSADRTARLAAGLPARLLALMVTALACLSPGLGLMDARAATLPAAAGLPPLVRTNHRTFAIPFRLPESTDPDADAAPQRVILNVSQDLGMTWSTAGETAPQAGSFTYTAEVDGEYWFRLRAIDRKGRSRGGEGPDIRILVDAAGPRLAARLWKGPDGEIVCRYAAADDSLRLDSLLVEYRGPEDRGWKNVAADAVLAREAPAHLVGETIWWAGEKVDQLTARITITDESGNRTVKQYALEPSDPRVDQATLAEELGLPSLPTKDDGGERGLAIGGSPQGAGAGLEAASLAGTGSVLTRPSAGGNRGSRSNAAAGWPAERATWSEGQPESPTPAVADNASEGGEGLSLPTAVAHRSGAAALLPRSHARQPVRAASTAVDPLAAAGITGPVAEGQTLEYRGRPLHLARSRRFAWDYEIPAVRRAAGPLRAELWTTRDGGVTWQKTAVDADGRSPIDVELAEPGFYGVRLELVAAVPDAEGGPRSGAEPDAWVGVDDRPPDVELISVDRDESGPADALVIRYAARDPLLPSNSVRLLYSPNAEGPWATIVSGAANEGFHRWEPGRTVPARVHLRVEAIDAAGNKGIAVGDEAVSVAPTRFGGRLGGLRIVPTP
jgi:hypothetical protein